MTRRPVDRPSLAGILIAAVILAAVAWATANDYGDLPESVPPLYTQGGAP